jgi:uncharacterized protein (TIGR00251 family)
MTTVALEPHAEGVVLPVRAQPNARRSGLQGVHDGHLKVAVTQAAEKGKANRAIIDVMCRVLSLRKSQVELLAGETASRKRFLIRGIRFDEIASKLAKY